MTTTGPGAVQSQTVDLKLTGMTCAACANRIEKKLNRLEGAQATVNLALETAAVTITGALAPADLIAAVEAAGYGATLLPEPFPGEFAGREATPGGTLGSPAGDKNGLASGTAQTDPATALRQRLIICSALTAPVLVLSMVPPAQFEYWQWLSLTLAAPVVVWGALPFHRAAWINLRHGAATMDTLISLGVTAAFIWSLWALFLGGAGMPGMRMEFAWTGSHGQAEIYLEVAAALTVFILAGRYFEARAKRDSGAALRALLDLGAKDVTLLPDGIDGPEKLVPVSQLTVGDLFVVRPGQKIATDGIVVAGASAIDASLLTGESVPVEAGPGDPVAGATVAVEGRLVVQASRIGSDTALAQIAKLVTDAQSGKAHVQRLADRVAGVFVPIVIVIALVTLAVWLMVSGDPGRAFTAAVAVLIIACPCALGLATPTALLVGTGRGAQLGILIKGPEVLESVRRIDTVVLDKTGTVTTGRMSAASALLADQPGSSPAEFWRLAGAVEAASGHPVAVAVTEYALVQLANSGELDDAAGPASPASPLPAVTAFAAVPGQGVQGEVLDRQILAGKPDWVTGKGLSISTELVDGIRQAETAGQTVIAVGWDGQVQGIVAVADHPKAGSAQAVAELRRLGLEPVLLTGDNELAAQTVAQMVGIDQVIAGVLPGEKAAVISRLQEGGAKVAMVGDGINDSAALATADLGLAMGGGADAAIQASDLTLVRDDLRCVPDAIRLSAATLRTIKGNLFWAFAYNAAALPLAAFGLLNPLIAGAAMALSSIFVVSNSLRLRGFKSWN
ncbi:MAG: heavy metal translocating P-type ATPase [Bifidobacteriaceae bacterium]|jgi:Cu+-exporting ATPase|nr:heavy metal translocating P-type ATPase [Bifidobacteriaceae bacterium]